MKESVIKMLDAKRLYTKPRGKTCKLSILEFILQSGDIGVSANDIAEEFNLNHNTSQKILKRLVRSDYIFFSVFEVGYKNSIISGARRKHYKAVLNNNFIKE